ncbi:hypothetical protein L0222_08605 [bacterium]|nr:hypothetical protein [bacterium]
MAKRRKQTLGRFVRELLQDAVPQRSADDASEKLKVIERAAKYSFPIADLDILLAEIESGYGETSDGTDRFQHSDVPDRKRTSTKN